MSIDSAFPTFSNTESGNLFAEQDGLSIREYFAARAPDDIPDWFEHVPPKKSHGKPPKLDTSSLGKEPGAQRTGVETWQAWDERKRAWANGWNELAKSPQFLAEQQTWAEAETSWQRANKMARYFQWRWLYADGMLSARDEGF